MIFTTLTGYHFAAPTLSARPADTQIMSESRAVGRRVALTADWHKYTTLKNVNYTQARQLSSITVNYTQPETGQHTAAVKHI